MFRTRSCFNSILINDRHYLVRSCANLRYRLYVILCVIIRHRCFFNVIRIGVKLRNNDISLKIYLCNIIIDNLLMPIKIFINKKKYENDNEYILYPTSSSTTGRFVITLNRGFDRSSCTLAVRGRNNR